jgi:hypothetical protein
MTTSCEEWPGYREAKGYGRIGSGRNCRLAHRQSYADAHGLSLAELDDLVVMHICDNPPCVNPEHLKLGTVLENNRDKARKGRARGGGGTRRSHCKRGHELVDPNLYYKANGDRQCKTCCNGSWDDDE